MRSLIIIFWIHLCHCNINKQFPNLISIKLHIHSIQLVRSNLITCQWSCKQPNIGVPLYIYTLHIYILGDYVRTKEETNKQVPPCYKCYKGNTHPSNVTITEVALQWHYISILYIYIYVYNWCLRTHERRNKQASATLPPNGGTLRAYTPFRFLLTH